MTTGAQGLVSPILQQNVQKTPPAFTQKMVQAVEAPPATNIVENQTLCVSEQDPNEEDQQIQLGTVEVLAAVRNCRISTTLLRQGRPANQSECSTDPPALARCADCYILPTSNCYCVTLQPLLAVTASKLLSMKNVMILQLR